MRANQKLSIWLLQSATACARVAANMQEAVLDILERGIVRQTRTTVGTEFTHHVVHVVVGHRIATQGHNLICDRAKGWCGEGTKRALVGGVTRTLDGTSRRTDAMSDNVPVICRDAARL